VWGEVGKSMGGGGGRPQREVELRVLTRKNLKRVEVVLLTALLLVWGGGGVVWSWGGRGGGDEVII